MCETPDLKGNGNRITIAGARRMLGMISRNYEDDEIQDILNCLYGISEQVFDELE